VASRRPGHRNDLVLEERPHGDRAVRGEHTGADRAERDVDGTGLDQITEPARRMDAELNGKIVGP
jgi:hypothetical protein